MSDPVATAPARRAIGPWLIALALTGFLAGLLLMAALVARFGWFTPKPSPLSAPAPRALTAPVASAPLPAIAPADPAALAAREAALSSQLAALEARLAATGSDVDAAAARAGRSEAILLAFAARRAIEAGTDLGALDGAFRARFAGSPREVSLIEEAVHHPITLEDLRGGMDVLSVNLLTGNGGWLSGLWRELGSLVVIHRADTPSPVPADRVALVRRLVEAGRVEAAVAEASRLPGAPDAADWMAGARRYVAVHHALDALEAAAVATPVAPAAAPAPIRRVARAQPAAPAPAPTPAAVSPTPTREVPAAVPPAITR